MSSLFVSEEARQGLVRWHHRFRSTLPAGVEAREVEVPLGRTHLLVGGPPDAPPLVLLHGAMASSAHVLGELTGLLERFRVYAVDVLGQSALSADVQPSVKDATMGVWLRDVLDALGLERVFLVGVSWGGFVSLRLMALAPERLEKVALLVPAGLVNGTAWVGLSKLAWPMLRYRLSPTPARLAAFVEHLLTTKGDDWTPYLGEAVLAYRPTMKVPRLARDGELDALKAPVLVVAAEADVSFPGQRLLDRARTVLPSLAETELLEGVAHSPPTTPEFRAWLSARLTRFFLGTPGAGPAPA